MANADMIYILNKYDEVVGALSNTLPSSTPYFEDLHTEILENGYETLEIKVPIKHPTGIPDLVKEENKLLLLDMDRVFHVFRIKRVQDNTVARQKVVFAETESIELLNDPFRPLKKGGSPVDVLNTILSPSRWKAGIVETATTVELDIKEHTSVLAALHEAAALFGLEIRFRITFDGSTITGRYVDLLQRRGESNGVMFEYNQDIKGLTRTIDTTELATALIGVGKSDETENPTTFQSVAWSKAAGNPADKPLGQDWIGDPVALQQFGVEGRHIFRVYTMTDESDPLRLLSATWDELQRRIKNAAEYEVELLLLEKLSGYSHKRARIGDMITIKDTSFATPLVLEARILEIKRSQSNPSNDAVVLGEFRERELSDSELIRRLQAELARKSATWEAGGFDVIESATAPTDPAIGQFWLNIGKVPNVWNRWDGTKWVPATPERADQLTYADGLPVEYYKPAAPGADKTGDNVSKDTTNVGGKPATDVKNEAEAGKAAQDKIQKEIGSGTIESTSGSLKKSGPVSTVAPTNPANGDKWVDISDPGLEVWKRYNATTKAWEEIGRISLDKMTGQIKTGQIGLGAVGTQQLADLAITLNKIGAGAVDNTKIVDDAISAAKIQTGAITTIKIEDNAVDVSKIINNAITEAKIATGAITNTKIGLNAVTTPKIANNAVDVTKIIDDAISAAKIQTDAVTTTKIQNNAVDVAKIVNNAITEAKLNTGAVTNTKIGNTAVNGLKIANNAITDLKVMDEAITTTKIFPQAITNPKIMNEAVDVSKIINNAITDAKIMTGAVTTTKIGIDAITNEKMANDAITSNEILNRSIGNLQIALSGIKNENVADRTISAGKIVASSITANEIGSNAITALKIAANAVTVDKLAANAVTADKIAANAITAGKIMANAITAEKISTGAIVIGSDKTTFVDGYDPSTKATPEYILSRGENLVTNGTGYLKNNYNFSGFEFDPEVAPSGSGSFRLTAGSRTVQSDELLPVNPEKTYRLSVTAKGDPRAKHYFGLTPYDRDGLVMSPQNVMYQKGSTTKLAQDLKPGDTVAYFEDLSNWFHSIQTYQRSFIFWDHVSKGGFAYPTETYSRNYYSNVWDQADQLDKANNKITLKTAWDGPLKRKGTPVSMGNSGSNYKYIASSNKPYTEDWTTYSGTIGGVDYTGTFRNTQFPPYTANVRLLFLANRDAGQTVTSWHGNIEFMDVSQELTAQDYANTQYGPTKEIVDVWKYPGTTYIHGGQIYTDSVTTKQIAANAITTVQIAANTINAGNIAANAITSNEIAANTITAADIATGTITANEILGSTITGDKIAANAITATHITGKSITAVEIAANTITTGNIATNAITSNEIAANTITASNIATGAITANEIAGLTITGNKIAANTITATQILGKSITAVEIAANTINTGNIAANAITTNEIAANTINATNIATGAITANEIAGLTITGNKIAANAITATHITGKSITAAEIKALAITAGEIATSAITADKVAANAISAGKIAATSITGDRLAANTITATQIATRTISADRLVSSSITANEIATNAITATKILAATITGDRLAARSIGADKIVANSITANEIASNTITANQIAAKTITTDLISTQGISADVIKGGTISANVLFAGKLNAATGTFSGDIKTPVLTIDNGNQGSKLRMKMEPGVLGEGVNDYTVFRNYHTAATGSIMEIYKESNGVHGDFDAIQLSGQMLYFTNRSGGGVISAHTVISRAGGMFTGGDLLIQKDGAWGITQQGIGYLFQNQGNGDVNINSAGRNLVLGASWDTTGIILNAPLKQDLNVGDQRIYSNRGWIAPSFINNAANFGQGYDTAGYYKDIEGFIRLKGVIKAPSVMGNAAFQLPFGFRPSGRKMFAVASAGAGAGRIDVDPNGYVYIVSGAVSGFISLEGIYFNT